MSIDAMKKALEILHYLEALNRDTQRQKMEAITALRAAIADAEKLAMRPATRDEKIVNPGVYEVPAAQQAQHQPLTGTDLVNLWRRKSGDDSGGVERFARAIEAAHGIKENT